MAKQDDRPRSAPPVTTSPTAQGLKPAIDGGRTADKVPFYDRAASPLGADEAAGITDTPHGVATSMRQELKSGRSNNASDLAMQKDGRLAHITARPRPVSPNIQLYRPQLTSVLSIANRITGVLLSVGAVGLVVWLVAAASGPQAYDAIQTAISSGIGQVVLFGFTFAFFLHFCGGIRHLVWDTVHGFELRSIYLGGWVAVAASVVLTVAAWVASAFIGT